jgi:hypothetical protein
MSHDFEKWLATNRNRDEDVISGEKIIEEIRQKIQGKVTKHLKETEDQTWCKCDTCTLIRLKACKCDTCTLIRLKAEDKEIIGSLAYAGLEYLLGENFNGAAALYYYSYFLLQGSGEK